MKLSITFVCIFAIFHGEIKFTSSDNDKFEIDLFYSGRQTWKGIKKATVGLGNSLVNLGRLTLNSSLRTTNYFFNVSFALNYKDAEYFFYHEQKLRDVRANELADGKRNTMMYNGKVFDNADDAKTYEYYCEQKDVEVYEDYCWYAIFKNRILSTKIELDLREKPECEFHSVYIRRFKYRTTRMFLRCPVVSVLNDKKEKKRKNQQPDEPEDRKRYYIYITSVENALKSRLMFYLFMHPPEMKRKNDNSLMSQSQSLAVSQSQSIEYDEEQRAGSAASEDFSEYDLEMDCNLKSSARASSSMSNEIIEIRRGGRTTSGMGSEKSVEESTAETKRGLTPAGTISIRDNRHTPIPENMIAYARVPRAARSSLEEYPIGRSSTDKKAADYQRPYKSMPVKRGPLTPKNVVEDRTKLKSEQLEIVNLFINRRHIIGTKRPKLLP